MSPRREGWEELVIRVFCLVELRIFISREIARS